MDMDTVTITWSIWNWRRDFKRTKFAKPGPQLNVQDNNRNNKILVPLWNASCMLNRERTGAGLSSTNLSSICIATDFCNYKETQFLCCSTTDEHQGCCSITVKQKQKILTTMSSHCQKQGANTKLAPYQISRQMECLSEESQQEAKWAFVCQELDAKKSSEPSDIGKEVDTLWRWVTKADELQADPSLQNIHFLYSWCWSKLIWHQLDTRHVKIAWHT